MKNRIFTLIIALLTTFSCLAFASETIPDSIRIIGYRTNVNLAYNIGRQQLLKNLKEDQKESPEDVIDTMVVERNLIISFLKATKKLDKIKRLPIHANQILLEAQYLPSYGYLAWKENNVDYRILVVLYYNEVFDFIWFTTSTLDMGSHRYMISKSMAAFMSQYTPILTTK